MVQRDQLSFLGNTWTIKAGMTLIILKENSGSSLTVDLLLQWLDLKSAIAT